MRELAPERLVGLGAGRDIAAPLGLALFTPDLQRCRARWSLRRILFGQFVLPEWPEWLPWFE